MKKELIINGIKYIRAEEDPIEPVYKHNGLMWSKTFVKMTWQEAVEFCEKLEYGGFDDWRLPTIQELISIIDFSKYDPACSLPDTILSYYWSSTTYAGNTDDAWSVYFVDGYVGSYDKSGSYYVRAVRDTQTKEVPHEIK